MRTALVFCLTFLLVAKANVDNNVDQGLSISSIPTPEEHEQAIALGKNDQENRGLFPLAYLFISNFIKTFRSLNFISYSSIRTGPQFDIGFGCSNGTAGNPNDMVHCFSKTFSSSLRIGAVGFWMVDGAPPLPMTPLTFKIWDSDLIDTLYEQEITDVVAGLNEVILDNVFEHPSSEPMVCVGVGGTDETESFRLQAEGNNSEIFMNSYVKAPVCGVSNFTSLEEILGDELGGLAFSFYVLLGRQG
mmetsp:Transcript_26303/g.40353  ORF Transcript_26303/g.40353 Transcript_26303/m.40353 type:complete len:246 (-) Transcript_26303:341-1078(-)